ncbi:MAG: hypothetical protein GF344_20475 [Chitinivibrionales bacterium]|nr:hypothetical protein [Chitinivibrionales bacterium]MBD3358978.1 hypothetical protein [Chitinivibrionales bacterium]
MFRIERGEGRYFVYDGDEPVLMVAAMKPDTRETDLVYLRPPDTPLTPPTPVFHFPTVLGVRLHCLWRTRGVEWAETVTNQPECDHDVMRFGWRRFSPDGAAEEVYDITLRRKGEAYVVRGTTTLLFPTDKSMEFVNVYCANLANGWPDDKRFTKTVQEIGPGEFRTRAHSPLTIVDHRGLDFGAPGGKEPKKWKGPHVAQPLCEGGLLFWAGERVTPAFRIVSASASVVTATCDMWRDQHVCMTKGIPRKDGRYEYNVEYELFDLPREERDSALANAKPWEIGPLPKRRRFPQLKLSTVNRFERPVSSNFDKSVSGFYYTDESPDGLTFWDENGGPSGAGAIVLNTLATRMPPYGQKYQSVDFDLDSRPPWINMRFMGYAIHLFPGRTLNASCDILTEGEIHGWVEIREAQWSQFFGKPSTRRLTYSTERVGCGDWRTVHGKLTAQDPASGVMVTLCVAGKGSARFSNLLIAR